MSAEAPPPRVGEYGQVTERDHARWCMTLFSFQCDCGVTPRPPMSRAECENAKVNHDDGRAQEASNA